MSIEFNPDIKNICGPRVKKVREDKGLTGTDVTVAMQVMGISMSPSSLSGFENQRRAVCDYELLALADILKVSVNWLLGLTNESNQ